MYGIVKGRGIFAISNWVMQILGRDPQAIAKKVLLDSMLDPELASMLMTKELGKRATKSKVESKLHYYIVNNYLGSEADKPTPVPVRSALTRQPGITENDIRRLQGPRTVPIPGIQVR